jgi:hypothetical protein
MLNHRHELYRLADLIDWSVFDTEFGSLYCPDKSLTVSNLDKNLLAAD